jgi:hypothetical protein
MDHIEDDASRNSVVVCVLIAMVMFLSSCCLATTGGYTHRHKDRWKGFMKYAVEMGSGAMICIHTYQVSYRLVQTFKSWWGDKTHRQHGDIISLLLLFQNKGNKLKTVFNHQIQLQIECTVKTTFVTLYKYICSTLAIVICIFGMHSISETIPISIISCKGELVLSWVC